MVEMEEITMFFRQYQHVVHHQEIHAMVVIVYQPVEEYIPVAVEKVIQEFIVKIVEYR
jgi:hypothetical protein